MRQTSIARIVKGVFITIVVPLVIVLLLGIGFFVWGSWISPLERRSMRTALDQIDEVGKYEGSDPVAYEQKLEAAKRAILVCRHREITAYDRQLVPLLDMQLDGAQTEHDSRVKAQTEPRYQKKVALIADLNHSSEALLREHLQ